MSWICPGLTPCFQVSIHHDLALPSPFCAPPSVAASLAIPPPLAPAVLDTFQRHWTQQRVALRCVLAVICRMSFLLEIIFLAFLNSIIIMLTRVEVPLSCLPMLSLTPSIPRLDGDRESEQQRWAAFEQLLVEQALEAQIVTGQRAVVAGRRVMRTE
jgi:hypothetical protein